MLCEVMGAEAGPDMDEWVRVKCHASSAVVDSSWVLILQLVIAKLSYASPYVWHEE